MEHIYEILKNRNNPCYLMKHLDEFSVINSLISVTLGNVVELNCYYTTAKKV